MGQIKNEIGNRYGRLVVKEFVGIRGHSAVWKCLCDCGNECDVTGISLRFGYTHSCGCLQREVVAQRSTKYERVSRRLYHIWYGLVDRCTNQNCNSYKNYGARGISVCEDWKDANNFFRWAFQSGYKENLTIERIDYDGDYCPENCRWATIKEQQNNRRNNRRVSINGQEKNLQEWCDIFGISQVTVHSRIRLGWDIVRAIMTPAPPKKKLRCIETGEVFEKALDAQKKYGGTCASISMAAAGKTKSSRGLHWEYVIQNAARDGA